jgi:hypothetical protein
MLHAPDLCKLTRIAFGHKVALVRPVVEQALIIVSAAAIQAELNEGEEKRSFW